MIGGWRVSMLKKLLIGLESLRRGGPYSIGLAKGESISEILVGTHTLGLHISEMLPDSK